MKTVDCTKLGISRALINERGNPVAELTSPETTYVNKTMSIRPLENGNAYAVHSNSGNDYTVRFVGRPDNNDGVTLWECDCPAGQHGRDCKHLAAVVELSNAICDEMGY